jgi:hypothetical protein
MKPPSPYPTLSAAHAEVVRERQMGRSLIYDRIISRRGPSPKQTWNLSEFNRPQLIRYIAHYYPKELGAFKPGKRNTATLRKLAEDIRDWRGQPTDYPSDEDLIIFKRRD